MGLWDHGLRDEPALHRRRIVMENIISMIAMITDIFGRARGARDAGHVERFLNEGQGV